MVEKKKSSDKEDETAMAPVTKKVSVGAWWNNVVEESRDTQPVESAAPAEAPVRKRPPRRKKKPAASAPAAPASTEEKATVETEKEERGPRAGSEDTAVSVDQRIESSAEEAPAARPARKRPPRRRKKPPAATVAGAEPGGAAADGTIPAAASIAAPDFPPGPQSEPAAATTGADGNDTAAAAVDGDLQAGDVQSQKAREGRKRPPRKRGPRKPKSKKESPADDDSSVAPEEATADVDGVAEEGQSFDESDDDDILDSPGRKQGRQKAESADEEDEEKKGPRPVLKLLINAEEPEECRLALLEDGRLESIHVATVSRAQTKNNIYKGRIVAIEANLQAAFIEYGTDKNGFLPFSEIHPEYYHDKVTEKVQRLIDQQQWKKLSITDVVERGQEVLVQVVKEEVGKKGANMTTFLSLPGRCVVLMPGSDSTGISRKISGEERRSQLRDIMQTIDVPEGIGWIVRTASIDINKAALARDVDYLLRLWEDVKKRGQDLEGVGLIYQDHNHVLRFLREHYDPDIEEILVDNAEALELVKSFVELLPTKQRNVRVKLHRGARPIFNMYSIEDQIESIYQPRVNLPSGGSIVIDPTEALVAIDVNSGSTSRGQNFEDSIFQANMEAAKELARQLRLRDLGGLIVVDFIDMRAQKNIREVERQVKVAMKRDKAKVDISRISKFGLMQISRQKLGAPIEAGNYTICPHCKGRGMVRSVETLALYYLRRIHTGATRKDVVQVECRFPLDVAQYLLNSKRNEIIDLEEKYTTEVIIIADPSFKPADNEIVFHRAEKDDSSKKRS